MCFVGPCNLVVIMMITRITPSIHISMDIVDRGRTSSLSGPRTHIAYHMLSVNTRAAVTLSQAGEITITVPDVMFRLNRRTLVTPQVRQFAFAHLHLLPVKTAAERANTVIPLDVAETSEAAASRAVVVLTTPLLEL